MCISSSLDCRIWSFIRTVILSFQKRNLTWDVPAGHFHYLWFLLLILLLQLLKYDRQERHDTRWTYHRGQTHTRLTFLRVDSSFKNEGDSESRIMKWLTALVSRIPYMRPHRILGSVTFQNTCRLLAPKVRAASSSAISIASSTGINSLTTNGIVTNNVASAIPANGKQLIARYRRDFENSATENHIISLQTAAVHEVYKVQW